MYVQKFILYILQKLNFYFLFQKFIESEEIIDNSEVSKRDYESCEKEKWKPR